MPTSDTGLYRSYIVRCQSMKHSPAVERTSSHINALANVDKHDAQRVFRERGWRLRLNVWFCPACVAAFDKSWNGKRGTR